MSDLPRQSSSPRSSSPRPLWRRSTSPRPSTSPGKEKGSTESALSFLDNLDIGQEIGRGTFSRVCIAIHKNTYKEFAVKKIALDQLNSYQYRLVERETHNMVLLNHPGLLKLNSSLVWTTFVVIISPIMSHRSCEQILQMDYPHGLPEAAIGVIVRDLLNALSYLHSRNLVHRTIKASHILISETGSAVLTGFRHMLQIPLDKTKTTTSHHSLDEMARYINWLAPEMLQQVRSKKGRSEQGTSAQDSRGFGLNSDLYSVGITVCELGNGVVPYSDVSPTGILVKKLEEPPPKLWDQYFLPSQEGTGVTPPYSEFGARGVPRDPRDMPYRTRTFSSHIKKFVAVCVVGMPEARVNNVDQAQKLKFVSTYAKAPHSETLNHLPALSGPLQFRPQTDSTDAQATGHSSSQDSDSWEFSS